jgi:SAM-dependent methyltransferase
MYNKTFYKAFKQTAEQSAKKIVPIIVEIFRPSSVVDLGCGLGVWLKVFDDLGVKNFLGIDGNWVPFDDLVIPRDRFYVHDLEQSLEIEEKFDLALSLETVEYIHHRKENIFIENITRLSDNIVFSGAIPFQGGTGHFNEKWQSYWVKIFENKGYKFYDIRPIIWYDKDIAPYYRQNLLIFSKNTLTLPFNQNKMIDIVIPEIFLSKTDPQLISAKEIVKKSIMVLSRAIKFRLLRLIALFKNFIFCNKK